MIAKKLKDDVSKKFPASATKMPVASANKLQPSNTGPSKDIINFTPVKLKTNNTQRLVTPQPKPRGQVG